MVFFHVDEGSNDFRLEVSEEFLDDRTPQTIGEDLRQRETSDYLRRYPKHVVILMEDGFLLRG